MTALFALFVLFFITKMPLSHLLLHDVLMLCASQSLQRVFDVALCACVLLALLLWQVQQEQLQQQLGQKAAQQQQQQHQDMDASNSNGMAGRVKLEPCEAQFEPEIPLPASLVADTPAMKQLTAVMLDYSRDLHTFAIMNRISTYELYTLNIETGVLGVPPPDGHWQKVAQMLKDRLSPQALADLCVARQLYSSTVMRIKQQRQLLFLQLQQVLDQYTGMQQYRTDAVFNSVGGPHCQGAEIMSAIESNMRKEYTLEGVYQWMTHAIIPMHVLAELVVHSYPYKADIHMTLQELMREQTMPQLTALQQLQLKQLQEQQGRLVAQQQMAQQQQMALLSQHQALQLLQQQQQQLLGAASGPALAGPNPGQLSSMSSSQLQAMGYGF